MRFTPAERGPNFDRGSFDPEIPERDGPTTDLTSDFAPACNGHDVAYGTCDYPKDLADRMFLLSMAQACQSASLAGETDFGLCIAVADVYYEAVSRSSIGQEAYCSAQTESCGGQDWRWQLSDRHEVSRRGRSRLFAGLLFADGE